METKMLTLPEGALSTAKLKVFFVDHLNRVYCVKSHLQERLPEMRLNAHFSDLKHAISETLVDVEKQVVRMNKIFRLLAVKPGFQNCQGVIELIEDAFTAVHEERHDPAMRDLSILFYLQNIESIEMASFKMLNMAAPLIDRMEIRQLLKENFDDAREDLTLLQRITTQYFKK